MPPWLAHVLRRVVVAPAMVLFGFFLWTTLPVTLIVAGIASAFVPGWLRPLRLLWIGVVHVTLEAVLLVEMFGLWIASGFGIFIRRPFFERVHYDLVQTYLVIFFREARRVLRLRISTVGPTPDAFPGQPLLVFCRHAGVGDSFSIMYALMDTYHREPRIVLKDMLAWDPMLGIGLGRLPSQFISTARGRRRNLEEEIAELASNLDGNDAFVIFPEGGNFTERRRTAWIERLRTLGKEEMAERGERMVNVLAPRPGGALAALDAAPDADVLLVTHTGLDHIVTLGDAWRSLPMDKELLIGWWRVPRAEIPASRDAQIDWLYDWWERIDAWVEEHRPVDLGPPRP